MCTKPMCLQLALIPLASCTNKQHTVSNSVLIAGIYNDNTITPFDIAEAPPSYRDIFGAKDNTDATEGDAQTKRWRRTQRPHTLSRRQRGTRSNGNAISKLFNCIPSFGSRSKRSF